MPKRSNEDSPRASLLITPKASRVEATKQVKTLSPTSKSQLIKIDILTKNGKRLDEDLPIKTLVELWNSLEVDTTTVDGCSLFRKPGGVIRAHFFLKEPIALGEIHPEPEFEFQRTNAITTDSYQCRILGLNDFRPPKPGETITICITRTNFSVPFPVIEQWIERFGDIVTKPRYILRLAHFSHPVTTHSL
jgi:hypothetical protein